MAKIWSRVFLVTLLSIPAALFAESVALQPDHPERYIVQKGDTLWDISSRFLRDPWLWPEIWEVNPEIDNPHLIFPGDEIQLSYKAGEPVLSIARRGGGRDEKQKLYPSARVVPLDGNAIPTVPRDAIAPFLDQSRVVSEQQWAEAPYIVSLGKEHLVGGAGFEVYARGIAEGAHGSYSVYRRGKAYRDPDSNDILGYEALYVGDAAVERAGDPATVILTSTQREVLAGDRLLPLTEEVVDHHLVPKPPTHSVSGKIISVIDGVTQIGQHQVVVINLGETSGMVAGNVLAVYQRGAKITDEYATRKEQVRLPDERAGVVMVFRPFRRVSYALVMHAERAMHIGDFVTNP